MATINKAKSVRTHEGAKGRAFTPEQELRRALMNCMLWEDQFYEDGVSIAARIGALVPKVDAPRVAALAIEAREQMKLRHAPLLIVREMARHETSRPGGRYAGAHHPAPDELSEFLATYWADVLGPMAARSGCFGASEAGLARAFGNSTLSAGQVRSRWRGGCATFVHHARLPKDAAQEKVWKQLIDGKLVAPDTWEVSLFGGPTRKRRSSV